MKERDTNLREGVREEEREGGRGGGREGGREDRGGKMFSLACEYKELPAVF